MDASSDRFRALLLKFLAELQQTFPEHRTSIQAYLRDVHDIQDKDLAVKFTKGLQAFSKAIQSRDESMFARKAVLFGDIDMSTICTPDVSPVTKKAVWQYLQLLLVMGTMITTKPDSKETDEVKSILDDLKKSSPDTDPKASSSSTDSPTSFIEDLAKDIAGELKLPENIDHSNPMQLLQALLSGSGGLGNIMTKVGEKLKDKLETGELNEQVLRNETAGLMDKMSKMSAEAGGPDISKVMQGILAGDNNGANLMQMMQQMFQGEEGGDMLNTMQSMLKGVDGQGSPNIASMMQGMMSGTGSNLLSSMMGGGDSIPDLDEIEKKVKKNMRKEYLEVQRQHQPAAAQAKRAQLQKKLEARKLMLENNRK